MGEEKLELGKEFAFKANGIEYAPAPSEEIGAHKEQVQQILLALGHPEAWVSDQSIFGDFKNDLSGTSNALGIELTLEMTIAEAAKILAAKS